MWKSSGVSCSDCYFRQEALCALATEAPCPTFRLAARGGGLTPPRQAQLLPLVGAGGEAERARAAERDLPLRAAYV